MGKTEHFDALETRDPAEREASLFAALPAQIAWAKEEAPAYGDGLTGVNPQSVTDRDRLAELPILRKASGSATQHNAPM